MLNTVYSRNMRWRGYGVLLCAVFYKMSSLSVYCIIWLWSWENNKSALLHKKLNKLTSKEFFLFFIIVPRCGLWLLKLRSSIWQNISQCFRNQMSFLSAWIWGALPADSVKIQFWPQIQNYPWKPIISLIYWCLLHILSEVRKTAKIPPSHLHHQISCSSWVVSAKRRRRSLAPAEESETVTQDTASVELRTPEREASCLQTCDK